MASRSISHSGVQSQIELMAAVYFLASSLLVASAYGIWPATPLDAERGPQGVSFATSPTGGLAQWDLSPLCLKTGDFGYRVVQIKKFARADEAALTLPPFPASGFAAVRLSFWAKALVVSDALSNADPRLTLSFAVASTTTTTTNKAQRSRTASTAIDAWAVRLATHGWKQHHIRLEIPSHLRRASIVTRLALGLISNATLCFDDFVLTPVAEVAAPPMPPPPPPVAGGLLSIDFEESTYREDDGALCMRGEHARTACILYGACARAHSMHPPIDCMLGSAKAETLPSSPRPALPSQPASASRTAPLASCSSTLSPWEPQPTVLTASSPPTRRHFTRHAMRRSICEALRRHPRREVTSSTSWRGLAASRSCRRHESCLPLPPPPPPPPPHH